jgi:isocitrate/isopropylmalate dehydrogenase
MASAVFAFPAAAMAMLLLADNYFGCILTDIQSFLTGAIDIVFWQDRHAQQVVEGIPGIRRCRG